MGIIGDLTAGEIIEQVVHANNIAKVRNVVFMGMGEPLNNYENMKLAVEFFTDSKRFSLSNRHVTVSTVGVLKNMYRLSDDMPYVNLALSLHAPNQEVRLKIVPTARAVSIEKLMEAVDYHILKNSQFIESIPTKNGVPEEKSSQPIQMDGSWKVAKSTGIMIEYILIRDVNDLSEHAHELAQLLLPRRGYVMLNLIPYNPTEVAEDFHPPSQEQVDTFAKICMSPPYCIHTRVRQEKGQDIAGACGQLAVVNKRAEEKKLEDMEDSMIAASAAVPSRSASSSPDSQCSDHSNGECCNDSKGCRGSGKQKATPKAFPLGKTNGAAVGLKSTFLEGSNGSDSDKSQSSSNQMGDIVNVRSILAHRPALLMYTNIFVALALSFLSFRKK
jgi:adenine C2-methylase RlmN of 23S rRNA A2503 and tRNA A37